MPELNPTLESPDCPVCGSAEAQVLFVARDRMLGRPGEFPVVLCPHCSLVFLRPRPTPEAIGGYYPDEYYPLDQEPSAEAYAVAKHLLNLISGWVREHNVHEPHLLDVGCGTGLFLHLAHQAGMKPQGIELSRSAGEYGRVNYGLDIYTGSLESAGLPEESFDIITMSHVLEHLPDPVAALRRLAGALKPGGLLFLSVPNFDSVEARFFGRRWFSLDAPRHLYQFTPDTLSKVLAAAGLAPVQIVHSSGTAGLVYSIMGDLTGVSLKILRHPISENAYHRIARVLHKLLAPICRLAASHSCGGALEVYAVRRS
jgi:SAM-dependent methyltransferase